MRTQERQQAQPDAGSKLLQWDQDLAELRVKNGYLWSAGSRKKRRGKHARNLLELWRFVLEVPKLAL